MIALDTDVLAIYHIFNNDPRYEDTKTLFQKIDDDVKAVTIFNLLELCGILSTARRLEDSKRLFHRYLTAEDVKIIFPEPTVSKEKNLWPVLVSETLTRIHRGMRLGDSTILWTLETNVNIKSFITWNTKHFAGKTPINILTPSQFR